MALTSEWKIAQEKLIKAIIGIQFHHMQKMPILLKARENQTEQNMQCG